MRTRLTTLTMILTFGAAGAAFAQEPAEPTPTEQQAAEQPQQPVEPAIGFTTDAGMIYNVIKPTATADFEMVLARLREALHKSEDPARQQQAASWKVYKASDTLPDGSVMYIFLFDETVKGADYDPVKILSEAFPTEVNDLYEKLKNAYASLNKSGMTKVMDMKTAGGM